ncbi:MAG TPA: Sir2 family NAD-dependent protein deacetylase [Rhizomicrobium sp.]|jgi:NAD-dependent deacetylase|nr:Sir2 family NAD-dependent protein deacetylase [Rhizomicrobium sp.]
MGLGRLRLGEVTQTDGAARLAEYLRAARNTVFFTGAGISTESGIPDFRSPGGIWTRMAPVSYDDFVSSAGMRKEAWRRRFAMEEMFARVRPNAGHEAVAALVARGLASHVITQNIDDLHRMSGIPAEKVIELHGNTRYAKCLDCGARVELEPIHLHFETHGEAPDCACCGGLLKTATISFGQAMPGQEMERAERATRACDFFLVLGSSLVVYPAAGFPLMARRQGARLAIVNREPTELDPVADLVLHGEIGPTLCAALDGLGKTCHPRQNGREV